MAANQESSAIGQLVTEIVEVARKSSRRHPARSDNLHGDFDPHGDFDRIARRDYARGLDTHFSKREMQALFMALEWTLPGLNREQFRPKPVQDLEKLASSLGADFRADAFAGPEGLTLLGFYAEERKRPLICVNSAHHPAAVAAAFWHEVGHHLTKRILKVSRETAKLSFNSDFEKHLDDPMELIADILVTLVSYPKSVARWMSGSHAQARSMTNRALLTDRAFSRTRAHLRTLTGFDFGTRIPPTENFHYLAGMIHFAKLRLALLDRYNL
jgi:hypothetical protein